MAKFSWLQKMHFLTIDIVLLIAILLDENKGLEKSWSDTTKTTLGTCALVDCNRPTENAAEHSCDHKRQLI